MNSEFEACAQQYGCMHSEFKACERVYACVCVYMHVYMRAYACMCGICIYKYIYICVYIRIWRVRGLRTPIQKRSAHSASPSSKDWMDFGGSRHQNRWIWELQVLVDWFSVDWFSGLCFIACMVLWASPGECGQSQAILQTANEVIGWPLSRFFFKGCCGRVPESAASPKQVCKPLTR